MHKEDQIQRNIHVQRYPLSDNWVHLHTDGVVNVFTGLASTGGVVRNYLGDWIMGFNHFLGNCSAFNVEIWASSISALARRIQKLLQHKEFWVVKHIRREANRVADRIAKMVCANVVGVNVMTTTPMELSEDIVRDKSNGVFVIVRLT
ncbi:hypothetical protein Goklo_006765 [Gossypium klotzschianum]|uniref:RNase H type-1 domain-containing protein n=1 Tax=Gossypium klotzschianum TaxID=34286 RepID=A0A7J8VJQ2_9ROSI|nr:hypothetical protein [Gossypium klotzschianum]